MDLFYGKEERDYETYEKSITLDQSDYKFLRRLHMALKPLPISYAPSTCAMAGIDAEAPRRDTQRAAALVASSIHL